VKPSAVKREAAKVVDSFLAPIVIERKAQSTASLAPNPPVTTDKSLSPTKSARSPSNRGSPEKESQHIPIAPPKELQLPLPNEEAAESEKSDQKESAEDDIVIPPVDVTDTLQPRTQKKKKKPTQGPAMTATDFAQDSALENDVDLWVPPAQSKQDDLRLKLGY
jgi:hypothetical protein